MGELLRRYWMPIAASAELDEHATKPARLLGEDLVLYKDKSGRYGLVGRRCPHRGTDLALGMVEERGLRCVYHGWLFNEQGRCLAQPFEETASPPRDFKDRVGIESYPVAANAGLLWAYLGPLPAPVVPNWRNFHKKGYRHICYVHLPCNWLQVMENAFDQVHNEWMHDKWSYYLRDGAVPPDRWRIRKVMHREFEFGWTAEIEYVDHPEALSDRLILWPNYSCFGTNFEWVVPIDDENTLVIYQHCTRFYTDAPFRQERIPYWTGTFTPFGTARSQHTPPRNQDFLVWCSQGPIVDRTREHLGLSDAGVALFRRKLLQQTDVVASGEEPKAIVREPDKFFLMLPESVPSGPERDGLPGALRSPADIRTVAYVAGFPEEIQQELARLSEERGEQTRLAQLLKAVGWKVGGRDLTRERHFAALKRCGLATDS
jgi:5,5'-dehydrodivanillate O-demethylase